MAERRAGESKSAAMRIKLKYPDVATFLAKYGPNINRTSVFISTKTTKPVGTNLRFEFVLVSEAGEQPVFRGEGTVEKVREADAVAPGKPQGMTVKYDRLFGDGEALVARAMELRGGAKGRLPSTPPPPPRPTRETTGEIELANPRDISSGEFEGLAPPSDAPPPAELPAPVAAAPPPPTPNPPPVPASRPRSTTAHVDVDALASEWQISTDRVDEILHRRRPRDPADAHELDSLLAAPAADSVSPAEATARLAQILDRRRRPR